jgi:hypothetical protein
MRLFGRRLASQNRDAPLFSCPGRGMAGMGADDSALVAKLFST